MHRWPTKNDQRPFPTPGQHGSAAEKMLNKDSFFESNQTFFFELIYSPALSTLLHPRQQRSSIFHYIKRQQTAKAFNFLYGGHSTISTQLNRGCYMATRGYEFYLRVLKVSLTSEQSERVRDTFGTMKRKLAFFFG